MRGMYRSRTPTAMAAITVKAIAMSTRSNFGKMPLNVAASAAPTAVGMCSAKPMVLATALPKLTATLQTPAAKPPILNAYAPGRLVQNHHAASSGAAEARRLPPLYVGGLGVVDIFMYT